ncbi:glycine-rich rna-binding protein grp1a [Quercus suber]|uniref:Glycine-rich rna-binding protein grp1a n=1 Tax=Quercus suber TaxID=58331 RepID=A0AAW0J6M9_QUESU
MASADVEFRCFVGGLAWATDDQALERAFSPTAISLNRRSSTTVKPVDLEDSGSSPSATRSQ